MESKAIIHVLKSVAIAYFLVFILLIGFSFLLSLNAEPEKYITVLSYVMFFAGAVLCGAVNAKSADGNGAVSGLIAGIIYAVIIFLISVFFKSETGFTHRLLVNIAAVGAAAASGFLMRYKRKPGKLSPQKSRENIRKKYMLRAKK